MKSDSLKRREIADIMEDFLENLSQEGKKVVIGEKAKAAAEELVCDYEWKDERKDDYKAHIIEQAKENGIDVVSACVIDMLNKITYAPTTIHALSTPRLIMPVLLEFMKEEGDGGRKD